LSALHNFASAACALYLLLAILAWTRVADRSLRWSLSGWLLTLGCLSAAPFYHLNATSAGWLWLQTLLYSGANLLVLTSMVLAWRLFEDRARLPAWSWWPALLGQLIDSYDFYRSAHENWPNEQTLIVVFEYLPQLIKLAYVVAAIVAILRSLRGDLLRGRFRLRYLALLAGALIGLEMLLLENLVGIHLQLPYDPAGFHLCWQLGLALWLGLKMLDISGQVDRDYALAEPAPTAAIPRIAWSAKLAALRPLMEEQAVYRDPALSVDSLAARLQMPAYRLRQLINGELGYRHFNVFVNDHRIAAACRDLADPERDHLPILTIALDVGFGSLSPFNRAFKERLQQTPSEYRAQQRQARSGGAAAAEPGSIGSGP